MKKNPGGLTSEKAPPGPKLVTSPSTQAVTYSELLTTLAKKKSTPTEPPNSGPIVRDSMKYTPPP
jgi:hypothetical protein